MNIVATNLGILRQLLERWRGVDTGAGSYASPRSLADLLLEGFAFHNFSPFIFVRDLAPEQELSDLFAGASAFPADLSVLRSELKRAVVQAIYEWHVRDHGPEALEGLARLAALLRASEAVPHLAHHLDILASHRELLRAADEDEFADKIDDLSAAHTRVISVLAGFATGSEARMILKRLYHHPALDRDAASILFMALVKAEPERFTVYLEKFRTFVDRHGDYYVLDVIWSKFRAAVNDESLITQAQEMPTEARLWLLDQLQDDLLRARVTKTLLTDEKDAANLLPALLALTEISPPDAQPDQRVADLPAYAVRVDPGFLGELVPDLQPAFSENPFYRTALSARAPHLVSL